MKQLSESEKHNLWADALNKSTEVLKKIREDKNIDITKMTFLEKIVSLSLCEMFIDNRKVNSEGILKYALNQKLLDLREPEISQCLKGAIEIIKKKRNKTIND